MKGDEEEEEEEGSDGGNGGGREGGGEGAVVLRRHTSCRVQCRVRFSRPPDAAGDAADDAAAVAVHLRVGLPPALLSREVLPVVSLPIRLLPPAAPQSSSAAIDGPSNGGVDTDMGMDIDARLGIKGCRTIFLPALERAVLCAESPGQAGIAGKVKGGKRRLVVLFIYMYTHVCM